MAFAINFLAEGKIGKCCVCKRTVVKSATADDGWDSWTEYRQEMMENLRARRYGGEATEDLENSAGDDKAANFFANNFREPGLNSEPPQVQEVPDVPLGMQVGLGGGLKFDIFDLDQGSESSEWFKEKQKAYADWESNGGYFKRTHYTFRDHIPEVQVEIDDTEWETKIDYSAVGRATAPGPRGPRKESNKAKRKKIDLDLFKVLGLQRGASDSEVKRAYRGLARKYHPDVNNTVVAAEKMAVVNLAYNVLKDPTTRRKYEKREI